MPELGPVAPIIGAILGAAITALVAYFLLQKRKRLSFYIGPEEDLTGALRKDQPFVVIKVGDKEAKQLFKRNMWVRNDGNAPISGLKFDLIIDGMHHFFTVKASADDMRFQKEVKIDWKGEEQPPEVDPIVAVSTTFMNPGEEFRLTAFYDARASRARVLCRMEDVKVKVRSGSRDAPPLGFIRSFKETYMQDSRLTFEIKYYFGLIVVLIAMALALLLVDVRWLIKP